MTYYLAIILGGISAPKKQGNKIRGQIGGAKVQAVRHFSRILLGSDLLINSFGGSNGGNDETEQTSNVSTKMT